MKTKFLALVFFVIMPHVFFLCDVHAKEDSLEQDVPRSENKVIDSPVATGRELVSIATVNIESASMTSQSENSAEVSFVVSNREKIQTLVKYAVMLMDQGKDAAKNPEIIDQKIFDERLNILPGEKIQRTVTYEIPQHLNGTYQIVVFVKNENGLLLGTGQAGEVELSGNGEYVEIVRNECKLIIDEQKDDIERGTYDFRVPINVMPEQSLQVKCSLKNNYKENVLIVPEIALFKKSIFGKNMQNETGENAQLDLMPQIRAEFSIQLPTALAPGEYEGIVSFSGEKATLQSDSIVVHYTIKGEYGSMRNIRLDKDYYKSGEAARLSINIINSQEAENISLEVNMMDDQKITCANRTKKDMQKSVNDIEDTVVEIPVSKNCSNPFISLVLKDADGNVLDMSDISLRSSDIPQAALEEQKKFPSSWSAIILLCIIMLISVYGYFKKRRSVSMWILFLDVLFSSVQTSRLTHFQLHIQIVPRQSMANVPIATSG